MRGTSGRPLHGFEISLWLDEQSSGALHLEDSALYQCLHRLEDRGLIVGQWGVSENNRRAKYYRLTAAGRKRLKEETDSWQRLVAAMTAALKARSSEV